MRAVLVLALAAPFLPAGATAGARVKEKIELAAGQDLVVAVDAELVKVCAEWPCTLDVRVTDGKPLTVAIDGADTALHSFEGEGKDGTAVRLLVGADGAWTAWWKEPEPKKKKGDKDDGEAKDDDGEAKDDDGEDKDDDGDGEDKDGDDADEKRGKKKGKDDEPEDESWKEKPVQTREEILAKSFEKARGGDKAKQLGSGQATAGAEGLTLTVPAAWLPKGSFEVGVNGYWGASIGGVQAGSADKTGVVSIRR